MAPLQSGIDSMLPLLSWYVANTIEQQIRLSSPFENLFYRRFRSTFFDVLCCDILFHSNARRVILFILDSSLRLTRKPRSS